MDWVREREYERVGEDCPGQGKAEEGNPGRCSGWNGNDFIKLYIIFDYRIHMSGSCLSWGLFPVVLCV